MTLHNASLNIEKDLIDRCRTGDRKACFVLYKRYADTMLNSAYRIVKNEEDARDVLQESFAKAFKNLGSYQFQSVFEAWLRRIVINTAINHLKKKKIQLVSDNELALARHTEYIEEKSPVDFDLKTIKKALMELPDGYRTIISLYLLEGYDHSEIADILGISINTSLSQYSRGKKRLISILQNIRQHG